MDRLVIEFGLWMAFAFFVGCCLGCVLRRLWAAGPPGASSAAEAGEGRARVPDSSGTEAAALASPGAHPSGEMSRPAGLAAARGGEADDLKRLSGVGPKLEALLHDLGVYHFDQIAAWTAQEVAWVDDHLSFKGRIDREQWIAQAKLLAAGREDEFARRFGSGGAD